MKIQIADSVSEAAVARVQTLLDDVSHRNVNFNGVTFTIERADYTCIPGANSYDKSALFAQIQAAIDDNTLDTLTRR